MKKTILAFVFLLLITANTVFADTLKFSDMSLNTSEDYQKHVLKLIEKYPDLLQYEELGLTYDGRSVYVVRMSENIREKALEEDFKVNYMHFLHTGGEHARETVNPGILIKMIEDYAKAYHVDGRYNGYNLKEILKNSVIHFVPLVNPDGHDLAKFGLKIINNEENIQGLKNINDTNYNNWKANVRGVDLNRNYPHYLLRDGQYVETNAEATVRLMSYKPAGAYYMGEETGSEIETQLMMAYMHRFPFRSFLSYHSRGEIVYSRMLSISEGHNKYSMEIGGVVERLAKYPIAPPLNSNQVSKGYITTYFTGLYSNPAATIESVPSWVNTTTPSARIFEKAFHDLKNVPLEIVKTGEKNGYFDYRLYVDNEFISDYFDKAFAEAAALYWGGEIVEGKGQPDLYLRQKLTREEALFELMANHVDFTQITVNALDTFEDTNAIIPTYAKNQGIIKGDGKNFFPDRHITLREYIRLIAQIYAHYYPEEDIPSLYLGQRNFALDKGYILESDLSKGFIYR